MMTDSLRDDYTRAWERHRKRLRWLDPVTGEREREQQRLRRKRERLAKGISRPAAGAAAARRAAAQRAATDARPFVGCDGEGYRVVREPGSSAGSSALTTGSSRASLQALAMRDHEGEDHGRDIYALLRMGTRELFAGGRRLETPELLRFICDHPSRTDILVAFAFDYDASNILLDVPQTRPRPDIPSRLERLLREGSDSWTWLNFEGHPQYGVHYRPRQHLRVCLGEEFYDDKLKKHRFRAIQGSTRTIYDVWGDFQGTFLGAISKWAIGTEEMRERIRVMKEARRNFETITDEIREYCAIECDFLAKMMVEFRAVCLASGIRPRTWNGAGKLATSILDQNAVITKKLVESRIPEKVLVMAQHAYYGGRFETSHIGWVSEPGKKVWEHDIASAYPAAMLGLPCLAHGHFVWKRREELQAYLADPNDTSIFVCPVLFKHPISQFWCGLPFREHTGHLCWPREGLGVYWSCELRSAVRLGATITVRGGGYCYEAACQCQSFGFVPALYVARQAMGKSMRGESYRLAINSLYGKFAQRIGKPKYSNPITAGLITALTRAKINDAIVLAGQRNVLKVATDAVYTLSAQPIAGLDIGTGLGQWEVKSFPRLFIVRPGLYWPPRPTGKAAHAFKLKTRGISRKFFENYISTFERAWVAYRKKADPRMHETPIVRVKVDLFIGLRYAYKSGNISQACQWVEREIEVRFGDQGPKGHAKRAGPNWGPGLSLVLGSKAGSPSKFSKHYERVGTVDPADADLVAGFEMERELFEAMPDAVDMSAPFT
jgi:hypothetical protein